MQLETVGEIVRILRGRRGLDQIDLARDCGWRDASAVSRIETDRIRPTRRTLMKLADSLAGPETFSAEQVRAMLFGAAGVVPTREEVEAARATMPALDAWNCPIYVTDFAWNVWAANDSCVELLGLPSNHRGRNLLDMYFEDGPVRQKAADGWTENCDKVLRRFRAETARRTQQRWYRTLLTKLNSYGDFEPAWERSGQAAGRPSTYRLPLEGDPRFAVVPIFDASKI